MVFAQIPDAPIPNITSEIFYLNLKQIIDIYLKQVKKYEGDFGWIKVHVILVCTICSIMHLTGVRYSGYIVGTAHI